ncbi:MAG: DUF5615 family PIN-like protein [Cyclobacteriaceae bacterium]|nr:DUF5615 family PIN-like protein [Cyclobacteriaceae bacterium]MCK5279031.1 DUF5615 family PIN-like protein [Cyclobacteriaceae bacterium]MCK5371548.1 DUF5615 family PIN-like protein [Cyclobacteriaceae bacterium]MCK5470477.1 DUF5615 family PIN-like protein [Cyclobacteriaceae bacterium]
MKFLCDVHISYKIVKFLNSLSFQTIHVNEILDKWHTTDLEICSYADEHNMIVITKDYDFRDSFYLNNTPKKLIKINLGNISNSQLVHLLSENLRAIQKLDKHPSFLVEIDTELITYVIGK